MGGRERVRSHQRHGAARRRGRVRFRAPDEALLRSIASATGGTWHPTPATLANTAADSRTARRPLWPWLVALALVLWFVDLLLRRVRIFEPKLAELKPVDHRNPDVLDLLLSLCQRDPGADESRSLSTALSNHEPGSGSRTSPVGSPRAAPGGTNSGRLRRARRADAARLEDPVFLVDGIQHQRLIRRRLPLLVDDVPESSVSRSVIVTTIPVIASGRRRRAAYRAHPHPRRWHCGPPSPAPPAGSSP